MSEHVDSLWEGVCLHLQAKLSKDMFDRWIRVIRPVSWSQDVLTLEVANDFYVWWLAENYIPMIRLAVAASCGRDVRIELVVSADAPKVPDLRPKDSVRNERPAAQAGRSPAVKSVRGAPRFLSPLNPSFTFGNFVVGSSNMFAHTASLSVAKAPGKAYNPLLIYGGPSLGKTHLMHAIGQHIAEMSACAHVCYLSAEAFLNEYIEAMREQKFHEFRSKFRSMDVLLIDDIQFLAGRDRIQEEFFHTFNELHNAHKQIVMTSDRPPAEVPGLEMRLVSRFEWGVITQIEPPDYETRVAILRKKAERFPTPVPDKILLAIAERIQTDVRALEGALNSVASYAALHGRPLGDSEFENLLRHAAARQARQAPSFEQIQKTVADYYDLRMADLTGRRRMASVALPRQVAMYLCRTLTPHSFPAIGESFGRNHATVLHACRLVDRKIKGDAGFRQAVSAIRSRLGVENSPRITCE
ncbi:MAG: chromosomal replication initiator protein DnaA [Kiritimatiellae bacterium]|nr:chromosomal replication initiator protein DnaA [Kiritimatiellia bacterium]